MILTMMPTEKNHISGKKHGGHRNKQRLTIKTKNLINIKEQN